MRTPETPHRYSLEPFAVRDWKCTEQGAVSASAFLHSPRIGNSEDNPIMATLYPKNAAGEGYVFEISPQLGCAVGCDFCACPLSEVTANLTPEEVSDQIRILQDVIVERGLKAPGPYQINFTDGGELLLNPACSDIVRKAAGHLAARMKVSTVLPINRTSRQNLRFLMDQVETYTHGCALQVSMLASNEGVRQDMARVPLMPFEELRALGAEHQQRHPLQRKITLTFTLTSTSHCIPEEMRDTLPPELFVVRLHPYKPNNVPVVLQPIAPHANARLAEQFRALGYLTVLDRYDSEESQQLLRGGSMSLRATQQVRDGMRNTLCGESGEPHYAAE